MNKFVVILCCFLISCVENEPRRPVRKSTTNFYKELIAQNKKLNQREQNYIKYLISKDTANHYIASNSGFWYTYNVKNNQKLDLPKKGDEVEIIYNVTDIHGNTLYKNQKKYYKVDKEDFIPALQDGIKLMKPNEIITFVIPSYRAFGTVGDNNKVNINQPIKSTVQLINIKPIKK